MWAMALLGLLVGAAVLVAAAALVRHLSPKPGNGAPGASPEAQAVAAEDVAGNRPERGRRSARSASIRARLLIAGAVWVGTALLTGAAVFFLASDEPKQQPAPSGAVTDGQLFRTAEPKPMPDLRFADGTGQSRTLAEFRGKAVLLNLWATWCAPCRTEMPALDRLQARLGDRDFEVVALSVDKKGLSAVQAFYRELGLKALAIFLDVTGRATSDLGAIGLPMTLLVDARGNEIGRAAGPREWDSPAAVAELERRIGHVSSGDAQ